MGSFSQAVPPTAPYKKEIPGAVVTSFEQVKEKIEETHRQSSQNMESCSRIERNLSRVSCNMVPLEEFNGLRVQVNEMNYMLMKIVAALQKESKEGKPADSKVDEDC